MPLSRRQVAMAAIILLKYLFIVMLTIRNSLINIWNRVYYITYYHTDIPIQMAIMNNERFDVFVWVVETFPNRLEFNNGLNDMTPLLYAAMKHMPFPYIKLLVDKGANLMASEDMYHMNVLHFLIDYWVQVYQLSGTIIENSSNPLFEDITKSVQYIVQRNRGILNVPNNQNITPIQIVMEMAPKLIDYLNLGDGTVVVRRSYS